ncbi:MAG: T9SS type A sorting domain-containing protein [Flavobacteriaceae bacterium]
MHKFYLSVFVLISCFSFAQTTDLLTDFEAEDALVMTNWNGELQSERVENPSPDNVNSSSYVAKFTMVSDPEQIGGAPHIEQYYNAEDNNVLTLKLWTSVEVDVAIKLENNVDWGGHFTIAKTTVTTLNQWVDVSITFDTDDILLNKYGLFFTGGNNAEGNVYYVDDLTTPAIYTTNQLAFAPRDGATNASRATDVTIYTNQGLMKSDAGELNDNDLGSIISLKETNASGANIPFTATINAEKNNITIDPTESLDFEATYYVSFDETAIRYNDNTSVLSESSTFTVEERVSSQMLIDFETPETDAVWTSWGSSAGFAKVDNPDKSGINTSDKVGRYTVPTGDEGLENGDVNGTKLTFFDYEVTPFFRVKVWVDKPVTVGMQLQNNPDWGNNPSGVKNILVEDTNQWVELVYNFSALTADHHNRVQLYFDRDKSGGSVAGDVYYFDEVHKGDTPPDGESALIPEHGSAEVPLISTLSITGSLAYVNTDGTDIASPENHVELREGDENGEVVATQVSISQDGQAFHIIPRELLDPNTTYWFGIIENTTKYVGEAQMISGISASFTTENATPPSLTLYDDHDGGDNLTSLVELYSENGVASNIDEIVDPDDSSNFVLQYNKTPETGGWSSVHYVLDRPIDFTTGNVFSIKVKSSEPSWVRFKVSSDAEDWVGTWDETDANVFLSEEFQMLYFDFKDLIAAEPEKDRSNYTHIKVFVNGGDSTPATFYIDDVQGPALGPDPNEDSDGDGVNNGEDDCPDTPLGETVDSNGCSSSQSVDSDGDGVPNRHDICDDTPQGVEVDANGCEVFTLPLDNFEVTVSSYSCIGTNDGSIFVNAKDQSHVYNVTIGGSQYLLNSTNGFNKTAENLTVGTYEVCFTVAGEDDFSQCSTVVLSQPDPFSIDGLQSLAGDRVDFFLEGATSFNMVHNSTFKTVPPGNLSVLLHKGANTIRFTTDMSCQGVFEQQYFNSEDILIHPNPVKDNMNIMIGGSDEEVEIVVRDLRGVALVRFVQRLTENRISTVDMRGYAKGVYFVEIKAPTVHQTSKILKK